MTNTPMVLQKDIKGERNKQEHREHPAYWQLSHWQKDHSLHDRLVSILMYGVKHKSEINQLLTSQVSPWIKAGSSCEPAEKVS
jgi:hypothetical protein